MSSKEAFTKATKVRAKAYAYFFEEMAKEVGTDKAMIIFSRVTYRMGQEKAKQFSEEAKRSAKKLAEEFIADPVGSIVFAQSILEADEDHAKIEMKGCPLVEMWEEMELSEDQICRMCDMAYRIDFGTIESLGYELVFPTRIACGEPSCILEIKKKK